MAWGLDQRESGQQGCRQGPCVAAQQCSPELMESQGAFVDIAEAESTGPGGGWAPRFLVWEVGAHGGAIHRGGTLRKRCDQVREEKPCTGGVPVT